MFFVALGLALATGAAIFQPQGSQASTTERIVTGMHTGLAIDGVDPVAYFTDSKPLLGRPGYEVRYQGAIWRFRNEGNKAAFLSAPEIYMPRYGGHDPVGVARGIAVAGNPLLWVVRDQHLYLFFSDAARAQFNTQTDKVVAAAESRWPRVASTLAQ